MGFSPGAGWGLLQVGSGTSSYPLRVGPGTSSYPLQNDPRDQRLSAPGQAPTSSPPRPRETPDPICDSGHRKSSSRWEISGDRFPV
ncbi:hypothetical protein SALBM311S_10958 [Streptomyces alboniger]